MSPWLRPIDILIAVAVSVSVYHFEQSGVSSKFPGPFYRHTASLAVAISELRFETTGYTAVEGVFQALVDNGLDPSYQAMHKPADEVRPRLEKALKAALEYQPTSDDLKKLTAIHNNEVGSVEIYKLSLQLFGYHAHAFAYFYYLCLALIATCFITSFHGKSAYLSSVGLTALLFNDMFYCTFPQLPHGSRQLPSLAFLAVTYIVCLCWAQPRIRSRHLIPGLLAAALLAMCLNARSSILWQVGMLGCLALVSLLLRLHPIPKLHRLQHLRIWPAVLVVVACLGIKVYAETLKHPLYRGDTSIGHPYWNSVIAVFAWEFTDLVPELSATVGRNVEDTDAFAEALIAREIARRGERVEDYLKRIPPIPGMPGMELTKNEALREKLALSIFLDFWREYPWRLARYYVDCLMFRDAPGNGLRPAWSPYHLVMFALLIATVPAMGAAVRRRARAFFMTVCAVFVFNAANILIMPYTEPSTRPDNYLFTYLGLAALLATIVLSVSPAFRRKDGESSQ